MRLFDLTELGKFATFVPNKKLPIYRWFYFKEGFSRELVRFIIKKFKMEPVVLDPFCGSGTTLLVCKELGYDCIGYDVSDLAVFVSKAKTMNYDIEKLLSIKNMIKKEKFKPVATRVDKKIRKFFNPHTLQDILFFRDMIEDIESNEYYFFKLALITSAIKCSYVFKDGSVLKVVKKPVPPFRKFFLKQIDRMIRDLKKLKTKECNIIIEKRDARDIKLSNEISSVITSPPYLNKIEYTKVYRIEKYLFFSKDIKLSLIHI